VKHRPSAAAGRMRWCGIAWPVTLRLGVGAHVRWHVRGALGGAGGMVEVWLRVGRTAPLGSFATVDVAVGESRLLPAAGGGQDSGSPALIRASRKPGGESIKPGWSACNNATESLGFNFSASANAAFASGDLSAAA
jgi:hypothetical protein